MGVPPKGRYVVVGDFAGADLAAAVIDLDSVR